MPELIVLPSFENSNSLSIAVAMALGAVIVCMALLWFRRSIRSGPEGRTGADFAPSHDEARTAPRYQDAARRIRGLLLLNLQPSDGIHQIEHAPPLGPRDAVIRAIQSAAPGMYFDSAGRGEFVGRQNSIKIDLGREDPVRAAVAAADGDLGIAMLTVLLKQQQWRAYAPRAGVFVESETLELFAESDSASR